MAQSLQTEFGTLSIPDAYARYTVAPDLSGLGVNGVLFIIGESDTGPSFTEEADISKNVFGPSSDAAVRAKYGSGRILDAFVQGATPSGDQDIPGSFTAAYILKTNTGTRASSPLTGYTSATQNMKMKAKQVGTAANGVQWKNDAGVAVVKPDTGLFTPVLGTGALTVNVRVNGGANQTAAANTAATRVSDLATALALLTGGTTTGGAATTLLSSTTPSITISRDSGKDILVSSDTNWTVTPTVGGLLAISGTAFAGFTGSYVIRAATATTINARKVADDGAWGTSNADPSNTPVTDNPGATTDLQAWTPIRVVGSAAEVSGAQSTLELLTSVTSGVFYTVSGTEPSWASATGAALTGTGDTTKISVVKNGVITEGPVTVGGETVLAVAYEGTTATMTITSTQLTTSVTGGTGGNLALTLSQYPTLTALVAAINANTGYRAKMANASLSSQPPSLLDRVTAIGICSGKASGSYTGIVKDDAQRYGEAIANTTALALYNYNDVATARADCGLPPVASGYLTGGARGGTTQAAFAAAVDMLRKLRGNFVIPLFSRSAAADIADGLTDDSSTYDISAIHTVTLNHVNFMSQYERGRNRQAWLSYRGTFSEAMDAARAVNSPRASVAFQDIIAANGSGSLVQQQPWLFAMTSAAAQAGGGFRNITAKQLTGNGLVQAAGDFDPNDQDQVKQALAAGLLVGGPDEDGVLSWIADQTSYSADSNFVYNSTQAMYAADVIAATVKKKMRTAFLGKDNATATSAAGALALTKILDGLREARYIAPSKDAPKGYRKISIVVNGPVMYVKFEVYLNGAIYFIPIEFTINRVEDTTTA